MKLIILFLLTLLAAGGLTRKHKGAKSSNETNPIPASNNSLVENTIAPEQNRDQAVSNDISQPINFTEIVNDEGKMQYLEKMKDMEEGKLGDEKIIQKMSQEELDIVANLLDTLKESAKRAEAATPIPGFADSRIAAKQAEMLIEGIGKEIEKEIVAEELEPRPPGTESNIVETNIAGMNDSPTIMEINQSNQQNEISKQIQDDPSVRDPASEKVSELETDDQPQDNKDESQQAVKGSLNEDFEKYFKDPAQENDEVERTSGVVPVNDIRHKLKNSRIQNLKMISEEKVENKFVEAPVREENNDDNSSDIISNIKWSICLTLLFLALYMTMKTFKHCRKYDKGEEEEDDEESVRLSLTTTRRL